MQNQTSQLDQYFEYPDSELFSLQIRQSTLPFSGMGLFSSRKIHPGELLSQYYGSIISSKNCMSNEFDLQDKMVQIDEDYCVVSRSPASRANDIVMWRPEEYMKPENAEMRAKRSMKTHPKAQHNARISIHSKQKAFLIATRQINPGEQIFIDYGFDYWDFFHKLHAKQ